MNASTQKVVEPCGLGFVQLEQLSDEDLMAHLQAGHDDGGVSPTSYECE